MRRSSLTLVGKDSILPLIDISRQGKVAGPEAQDVHRLGDIADTLISDISKLFPAVFKNHIAHFCDLVQNETDEILVTDALRAFAKFVKMFPQETPLDENLLKSLVDKALHGPASQVGNAVIILAIAKQESSCTLIMEVIFF